MARTVTAPKTKPIKVRRRTTNLTKIAWPVAICILVLSPMLIYRQEIGSLIPRTKAIKIDVSNKIAEAEFAEALQTQFTQIDGLQRDIKAIIDAASNSQDKAITIAWTLLEKRIRRILAGSHWNNGVFVDVRAGIVTLIELGVLAKNHLQNLKIVEDEHNRVLSHHAQGDKSITESATITAIQILNGLYSIALQENVVEIPNIKLYGDEKCETELVGVTGVMIKQTMIEGLEARFYVFPTTRTDYKVDERLTWDWNMSRIWQAAWYKDPKTGAIKKLSAAEFVGSDIDNL